MRSDLEKSLETSQEVNGIIHKKYERKDPAPILEMTEPLTLILVDMSKVGVTIHKEHEIRPREPEPQP